MSLFTVLKYPISDPPTNDELWGLPSALFDKWAGSFSLVDGPHPRHIGRLLRMKKKLENSTYDDEMKLLRKMMLEYDP